MSFIKCFDQTKINFLFEQFLVLLLLLLLLSFFLTPQNQVWKTNKLGIKPSAMTDLETEREPGPTACSRSSTDQTLCGMRSLAPPPVERSETNHPVHLFKTHKMATGVLEPPVKHNYLCLMWDPFSFSVHPTVSQVLLGLQVRSDISKKLSWNHNFCCC